MTKAIILLSGGLDSAVLLAQCVSKEIDIKAVNIHYGQKHEKEIESARALAKHYNVELKEVDLSNIKSLLGDCALTDDNVEIPEGHYKEETMKATVVPNRNMILLSVAGAYAVAEKASALYYGAHAGDHDIYPDCREVFLNSAADALKEGNYHQVTVRAPFIHLAKKQIAKLGHNLKVPFELTWTCYKGGEKACGKCGSCTERKEAFELNGLEDPIEYEK